MSDTPSVGIDSLLSLINSASREAIAEYAKGREGLPTLDKPHPSDTKSDSFALRQAIRTLEGACDQLCATLARPVHTMANRATAHFEPACIRVAVEARVADILIDHPNGLDVSALSEKTGIESRKLGRVLRLLAARHCFREVALDVFANNRLSLTLTTTQFADFIGIMAFECSKGSGVLYETLTDPEYGWSDESSKAPLMYALKNEGIEGNMFDWFKSHPERGDGYARAMVQSAQLTNCNSLIEIFPWKELTPGTTICDVGGGVGSLSLELALAHPHLRLTLQDLPETIDRAKKLWSTACPQAISEQRVEFVPLDFFKASPVADQDIYCLRQVIHDWSDSEALLILQSVRRAMRPTSRLFIQDIVLQPLYQAPNPTEGPVSMGVTPAPEPLLPNYGAGNVRMYRMDFVMYCTTTSRERALEEFVKLATRAGLGLRQVWDLSETSLLEFVVADSP